VSTPDAVTRFTGFAAGYDAARPRPPAAVVEVISQWSGTVASGTAAPDVVDLGAGTGLSAIIWAGHARTVTAIEPSPDMRAVAAQRTAADWYTVADGTAERTGLPSACADIVTVSQAMHWFDADRALPEIARILRPGGVLAAYDCDWPPCIDWETDAAYLAADTRIRELESARRLEPPRAPKTGHLARMRDSGLFRHTTEIAVHSLEQGDAGRLMALIGSQGGAVVLLANGATQDELGLTALREVAERRIPRPRTWWWTYRIRLAVR
jgi:SAM-dependent methyltransferase